MSITTAAAVRAICDDAPATMFAPAPVGAYRRGLEDAEYDACWYCPYRSGSRDAQEYAAGHRAGMEARKEMRV